MFLLPAFFVTLLLLYIRYIAQPRTMLKYKKKYGIKFKDLEKKGWLDSWLDEYSPPD
jgi:SNF family Na+-dependent transporter